MDALFDPLAAQVQGAFELLALHAGGGREHDLLDLGPGGVGLLADDAGVHRHLAPAVDIEAEPQGLGLDDGARGFLGAGVGARQEHLAHGDGARTQGVAGAAHLFGEEILRHGNQHAGAVAGLAVGVDRPAVPERFQRLDGQLDHFAARLAVDGADQAHAAGVMLGVDVIAVVGVEQPLVAFAVAQQVFTHCRYSAAKAARAALESR